MYFKIFSPNQILATVCYTITILPFFIEANVRTVESVGKISGVYYQIQLFKLTNYFI